MKEKRTRWCIIVMINYTCIIIVKITNSWMLDHMAMCLILNRMTVCVI